MGDDGDDLNRGRWGELEKGKTKEYGSAYINIIHIKISKGDLQTIP